MRLARGDELNAAKSSGALAVVELALGNGAGARMLLEEADVPLRAQDDRFGLAMNSIVRGHIEIADGNDSVAEELLSEGGQLMEEMGNFLYLPWQLEGMAVLAAAREDWVGAARHFGAHDQVTAQARLVLPLLRPESFERARAVTFEATGENPFSQQ